MSSDIDKLTKLNKNIAELKKRIQLYEGQKKAKLEEWEKEKKSNAETISTLKKANKELIAKLIILKNPPKNKFTKSISEFDTTLVKTKQTYPFLIGAKTTSEAIEKIDFKIIEIRKKIDLQRDQYFKKKCRYDKLLEKYNEFKEYKSNRNQNGSDAISNPPPETAEEEANKKLICHLENEIHRTNVQLMEAEHIRNKYGKIKASLMADAEKFDKSLRELKETITEQDAEIRRLQRVHKEALGLRDLAKITLQRQEHQSHVSSKFREKQAMEYRRQVEERKIELERIERKLFSSGKTLVHQESVTSSSGDQLTDKGDLENDPDAELLMKTKQMEEVFKKLMEATGATNPQEVLNRFLLQKESTSRLTYLRTAAEEEKKHLESQRELLTNELETFKFADVRDSDIDQEELDKLKAEIEELNKQEKENLESIEQVTKVITLIWETVSEMIFKLQESIESDIFLPRLSKTLTSDKVEEFLKTKATDEDLINILRLKVKEALKIAKQKSYDLEELSAGAESNEDIKSDELHIPLASPRSPPPSVIEEVKPQPLPMCYMNLIASRAGQSSSTTPGQTQQPALTDDESEIPSRNYLKQQAILIVDAKSRRKGFRPSTQRRK